MRTMTKQWKNYYQSLGQVNPKCPLENAIIKRTMSPWKYAGQAKGIARRLKAGDSILEVGCGYGGLAQEILNIIQVSYTVVDSEAMLIQTKKFLGDKVEYIVADGIETFREKKFTMFISFNCLSETPAEYRKYVLENIIKNCQKISILDSPDITEPTPKMLEDGWEMLPMDIEKWLKKYFIIEKRKHRHNRITYTGERRNDKSIFLEA